MTFPTGIAQVGYLDVERQFQLISSVELDLPLFEVKQVLETRTRVLALVLFAIRPSLLDFLLHLFLQILLLSF